MPKGSAPLREVTTGNTEKSSNIYSDNYDAETDIMQRVNNSENTKQSGITDFINRLFG